MIPRAEGPFLDTHYYYGSEWYDKRPFGYNWFPHHRAPIPRRYLMVPDEDDLSNIVWKEDNETNTNKEFVINRSKLVTALFTTMQKIVTVTVCGPKEEDDVSVDLIVGRKYGITYMTEAGLKVASGYLRLISDDVPDEKTEYVTRISDAARHAWIGLDCSTRGKSDTRKIWISSIREIKALEDDEDYNGDNTQDLSDSQKLYNLLTMVTELYNTCPEKLEAALLGIAENNAAITSAKEEIIQKIDDESTTIQSMI